MLLGDAAHAVTPFLGQGCNAAFEDVRYLREYWAACDRDWRRALPRFTAARKPDADALREPFSTNLPFRRCAVMPHAATRSSRLEVG